MNTDVDQKPTTRRYSVEKKEQAVQMVLALREELGTKQGTVGRVAGRPGIGAELGRQWATQAELGAGHSIGSVRDCFDNALA